jgi:ATP-dependent RNA helicase DeaD
MEKFVDLKLSPQMVRSVNEMGYEKLTPIQAKTLPLLLGETTDFLGMAATGTGKTAAFGIPLLERIDTDIQATQAVVLCPTRELALQVAGQISLLGKYHRIQAQAVYGGTGYGEQTRNLRQGAFVVVATPGRLIDHLKQGTFSLNEVKTVVFDEADEMISMGFKDDLEFILSQIRGEDCSRWLFAATMSPGLRKVADRYLRKPKLAQINKNEMLSGTVKQLYFTVREKNKPKGLCKLLDMADDFYGLIFCQTKATVVALTEFMRVRGYRVDCLHGDKSQSERERTLTLFRAKNVNILVCSDVAARGLDVKELTHVINYSLPMEFDSYVHRIGRTGRSQSQGIAINLVSPQQMNLVGQIERVTKSKMEAGIFPTRKEISQKKMATLLPQFLQVFGHEKGSAVLEGDWAKTLEGMTKHEIAGRFLAMSFPDLFDDRDKGDDIGIGEREPKEPSRSKPRYSKPHPRRSGGPERVHNRKGRRNHFHKKGAGHSPR